jgi:putative aldouronate transport system substrate-binding protein
MDERIGTMLAGGQYPDIIAQASQQYLMLRGGAFLRLDDLVFNGNYPLLADHVAPFMDKLSWRGGDVPDGLYIFPNYNRYYVRVPGDTHWGPGFWLQKAVLADAGYPDLTGLTPEGYLKLIEDYAAKNPEINGTKTIGFMVPAYPEHPWAMWNTIPLLAGSPNEGGVIVDYTLEVPKANIYAGSQYAYDWFKMLNEANQKGLVYPDVVRSQDDMNSLIATGAVLGFHHQRWAFSGGIDYLVQEKMYERTYVATMPTFGNIEPWYMDVDVMNQQQGMGISVDAEDPAMLLAFLEVMMTERWQKILYWGIEGEEYFVNDDGLFERTPEMVEQQEQIDWQASNRLLVFRDQLPKHQGFWPDGNPFDAGGSTIDFYNNLSDYDREFLENYNKSTWKEFLNEVRPNPVHYPAWQAQLSTEAQQADQQVQNTMLEFLPQLIFCDPADFDTVWEQYNAVLDMVPVEIYLEFINDYIASFY